MHRLKNELMLKEPVFGSVQDCIDGRVLEAIKSIDREAFIPPAMKHLAYDVNALPMGESQWISSPLTVAKITNYLMAYEVNEIIKEPDSVLEIGLGSGYQASVLSNIIRRVFSIERIESLWLDAKQRFSKLGITNVNTKLDDGMLGWKAFATYDRILFSACAKYIPRVVVDQLSDGGVLVAPLVINGRQYITRYTKTAGALSSGRVMEECEFVPIRSGVARNIRDQESF